MIAQKENPQTVAAARGRQNEEGVKCVKKLTQTPATVNPKLSDLAQDILSGLASCKQWVGWTWGQPDPKTGKPRKIPVNPQSGGNASHSNPQTWGSFEEAMQAVDRLRLAGVGFVLTPDDPYTALDLDHCLSGDPGPVLDIVERVDSYTEKSPSGDGLRIICEGKLPEWSRNKNGDFEAYDKTRFVTITGDVYGEARPIRENQDALDWYYKTYLGERKAEANHSFQDWTVPEHEIDQRLAAARRDQKLVALMKGETGDYPSASEVDAALVSKIAFYLGPDPEQIEALARKSALVRDKWDRRDGTYGTYLQRTIHKEIARRSEYYQPGQAREDPPPDQEQAEQPQPDKPEPPKGLDLSKALVDAEHFPEIPIQPKTIYLNPWVTSSQVILISAWRNLGKTMFAMSMLDSVTKGISFGPWTCELPATCLYMDGEMVADDVIDRLKGFGLGNRHKSLLIYSDYYANTLGLPRANLLDEKWRAAMQRLLIQNEVKIWVVDNLASLTPGADENVKAEWDPVNQWFLELRFQGITSVLVHHTGKGGTQRGTSSREDNIDISISLERPANYHTEDGARFICKFPKARVKTSDLPYVKDYEFQLKEIDGRYEWTFRDEQADKKRQALALLDQGTPQKDIAEELGVAKSYITKLKTRAVSDGLMTKEGRLTQSGFQKYRAKEVN